MVFQENSKLQKLFLVKVIGDLEMKGTTTKFQNGSLFENVLY